MQSEVEHRQSGTARGDLRDRCLLAEVLPGSGKHLLSSHTPASTSASVSTDPVMYLGSIVIAGGALPRMPQLFCNTCAQ
jgi:hypothetical protein